MNEGKLEIDFQKINESMKILIIALENLNEQLIKAASSFNDAMIEFEKLKEKPHER